MPPAVATPNVFAAGRPLHFDLSLDEESLLLVKDHQQQQQQQGSKNYDQTCYSYFFGYYQSIQQRQSSSSSLTSLTSFSSDSGGIQCREEEDDDDEEEEQQQCRKHNSDRDDNVFVVGATDDDVDKVNGDNDTACCCACQCCSRVWQSYYRKLQSHPVTVKSLTAFVLMILADLSAQAVEHCRGVHEHDGPADGHDGTGTGHIDWIRASRFGVFGLMGGWWTHYYYFYLDTWLPPTPKPWTCTTFAKVIIDQFIQAPAMLALIVMGLAFMEGRGWNGMVTDMDTQYLSALIHNWTLWLPVTVFNMAFVAPTLRVGFDNLIFFGWTIYLSIFLNQ